MTAIHVLLDWSKDMDARVKPAHDGGESLAHTVIPGRAPQRANPESFPVSTRFRIGAARRPE